MHNRRLEFRSPEQYLKRESIGPTGVQAHPLWG